MSKKRILGLDLGTNSIGWALVQSDFANKEGKIEGMGSRIIPMSQDVLGKFDSGQSISQTAERTRYRSVRRLYQRNNLRRERLHRVLNVLDFLPQHYANAIDFEKCFGQFTDGQEVKVNYIKNAHGKHEFLFLESFHEMVNEFKKTQSALFAKKKNGEERKIPYDWTLYYLRKQALSAPITKHELAWVILNYNQKRGYYQLRGEEDETDNLKNEEFHALKVKSVEATDDTNTKGTWYNVVLENDWIYRRQSKEDLSPWIGKTKAFIVTTQLDNDGNLKKDKEGNVKRSFRAVDSEKDWIAIKKKTERDIENSGKYISQYIYDILLQNPTQKLRGKLIKTIERKYYKKELVAILEEQSKHHAELRNKKMYEACIEELYPRNEAHQNNINQRDFTYLFVDDIIFYQRPLKSKKSTISDCQYEKRKYKDKETGAWIDDPLKGISKSNPLYQEFRLWQFLSNLKIYQKEGIVDGKMALNLDVTTDLLPDENNWIELFDFLNTKREIEQHQLLKFFSDKKLIPKQNKDESEYRWNYPEDKKYPCNETKAQFLSRFKNVVEKPEEFLTSETEYHLWHIVYSVKDKIEFEKALAKFANRYNIDETNFVEAFKKILPFKNDYGAYSEKALKKVLPLMRKGKYWSAEVIDKSTLGRIRKIIDGEYDENIKNRVREKTIYLNSVEMFKGLPTWLACYIVYDRHSESVINAKWETPADIDKYLNEFKQHSLRNPIVEQVVTETLRTVRDIWKYYGDGAENYFDEIHIELGREMKNPAERRKRISEQQTTNENTNHRIKELLEELMNDPTVEGEIKPHSPSQQELLKLFEEGVYQSQEEIGDDIEKIRKNKTPKKSDIQRYRLWLEQGYTSPYTGKTISLNQLFTSKYEIEHIIPQSRFFDNSLGNKIICEGAVNQLKDNQTAYEFIKNHSGERVDLGQGKTVEVLKLEAYEMHCKRYFKKNRRKLTMLLSEDIPERFIERQLNDSRYISKLVKNLMSNIVKEKNEIDAVSINVVSLTGSITSRLKQDWGLNDKWNELILPRFKRLNELTKTNDFTTQNTNGITIPAVPKELSKGFNKKRIDHRHHALDALVIACCTKDHINYISSLNSERTNYKLVSKLRRQEEKIVNGKKRNVAKAYKMPWKTFPVDAKNSLDTTVVSYKQNLRVINKTVNYTWQWVADNGQVTKKLVKQTKGDNWAIRKPLHKETISGKIDMKVPKGKVATATRTALTEIKNQKHIDKIVDSQIREVILPNHLKNYVDETGKVNFELAFSQDGIDDLNKNITVLNNGKSHKPIFKVPMFEIGSKFSVSESKGSAKQKKYVEAAKGTNLFFAIYWNEERQKRDYETVPLNVVIEHQKQVAHLPKEERTPIPINPNKGTFLFALSPDDLVYVPTDEEMDNPHTVDFNNLSKEQYLRLLNVNDFSSTCYFTPNPHAKAIFSKEVDLNFDVKKKKSTGSFDDKTASLEGNQIKDRCWKLKINRLGIIEECIRNP